MKKNRYELAIEKCRFVQRELRSVISGASRTVRLSLEESCTFSHEYLDVGTGLLGPLTTLYMHFVLQKAIEKGIRRLYFLARDGLVMKRVADLLIDKWNLNVDTKYLYCSRQSLLISAFRGGGDFEYEWITFGYLNSVSLLEICGRLNISLHDIKGLIGHKIQRPFLKPESPLTPEEKNEIRNMLHKPDFDKIITKTNKATFDATVKYLKQEGVLDTVPIGIVDSGWRASSQYALNAIISKAGEKNSPIKGFYLGLNSDHWLNSNESAYTFLFDWSKNNRDYRIYNFLCFEMLLAAPHGRTVGYDIQKGISVPLLSLSPPADRCILIDFHHSCATTFAFYYSKVIGFNQYQSTFPPLIRKLISLFISSPTQKEALAYGDFLMAGEMTERDEQVLAPPITHKDMFRMAIGKKNIKGFWPQGSLARAGSFTGLFFYRIFLDLKIQDIYRKYILKC